MKTEPTEARDMLYKFAEMQGWNKNKLIGWSEAADFADWFANQSSTKIKQLEWMETDENGDRGIEAKTPFGDYEIYENPNHSGYNLWCFDPKPYVFCTEIEARMFGERDYNRRVSECLYL